MGRTEKDYPYFRRGGQGHDYRGRDRTGSGRKDSGYDNAGRFSGQARRRAIQNVDTSQGLDMG